MISMDTAPAQRALSRDARLARATQQRRFGPGWPLRAAADGPDPLATFPRVLWDRGTRSWYVGGGLSLIWLITVGQEIVADSPNALAATIGIATVAAFAAAFLLAVPVCWSLPMRGRALVCATLFALSLAFVPWLGWGVVGSWSYVGVIVGMAVLPWRLTWMVILALGAASLAAEVLRNGGWDDALLFAPAIIVSISAMMAAFARTIAAVNQLKATQDEMANLAAERERSRVARDIHDILGHSLTVITVKTELAGRLIDLDPARAKTEIGEVEALARAALADVRATVAGVRAVTLSGELAAARVALSAAAIAAELPGSTETVPAASRELAAWVVREGVTNVVRHSGASLCRVTLDATSVEVADDGVGPQQSSASSTGLTGLRERVEGAGGRLSIGRSDLGGFALRVTL